MSEQREIPDLAEAWKLISSLESELSLSLAREQRLRDEAEQAENEWSAYAVTLNQRLDAVEQYARECARLRTEPSTQGLRKSLSL